MTESWLTRNVRPLSCTALCGTAVIGAVNGVPLSEGMWDVLQITLGGYVIGRSGEKIVREGGAPWQKPHQRHDES